MFIGANDGANVGEIDGIFEGANDGAKVGGCDGEPDGAELGDILGALVGVMVGDFVGANVEIITSNPSIEICKMRKCFLYQMHHQMYILNIQWHF